MQTLPVEGVWPSAINVCGVNILQDTWEGGGGKFHVYLYINYWHTSALHWSVDRTPTGEMVWEFSVECFFLGLTRSEASLAFPFEWAFSIKNVKFIHLYIFCHMAQLTFSQNQYALSVQKSTRAETEMITGMWLQEHRRCSLDIHVRTSEVKLAYKCSWSFICPWEINIWEVFPLGSVKSCGP